MSDCSTNAMKPKEPPKTCGTCGNCVAIVGHCDDGNDRVDLYDQSCESWTPRTDNPEQRCHQLEQVAREMLKDLERVNRCAFDGHTDTALEVISESVTYHISKLTALGVSVDD